MPTNEEDIARAREQVGWIYSDLKWLSGDEAVRANRERDELLRSLEKGTAYSFFRNKLGIGDLSPGCTLCGTGYWSCLYINSLCTARCFYCPQDRSLTSEAAPGVDGRQLTYGRVEDYTEHLAKYGYKGVGFSGGEPLLVFGKVLEHIRAIRKRFGKDFYLWLYTNGDLVDTEKLLKLKEAGLNEIRFDISARDYDLSRVALAAGIIDTVTVEVPAIPEDLETLKRCLPQMLKLGVKHLNLHQLNATRHNYKEFAKRNYTFLHYPTISVFESEMAALKLLKHAASNNPGLRINYCSATYKSRLQNKGHRERLAGQVLEGHEEITRAGYIKSWSIQDSPAKIRALVKTLLLRKCRAALWSVNGLKTEIFVHGALLKEIDLDKYRFTVRYFAPQLEFEHSLPRVNGGLLDTGLSAKKTLMAQKHGLPAVFLRSAQKLFAEQVKEGGVLKYLFENYPLRTEKDVAGLQNCTDALLAFKTWENIEEGFPRVY